MKESKKKQIKQATKNKQGTKEGEQKRRENN